MCCFCGITLQPNAQVAYFRPNQGFFGSSKTFQVIRKLSRLSIIFPDHPHTFQTIQRLFRPSRNFSVYPEIFHAIRTLSKLLGSLPDDTEASQTVRTLSRLSGNFPDQVKASQCNFKCNAQKLSGRVKTFWTAMPRCHDGFCASG